MKPFSVTPSVLEQARALGLTGDVTALLWQMYQDSTPFSHPRGTRRHRDHIFMVQDNTVTNLEVLDVDFVDARYRAKIQKHLARRQPRS